MFPRVFPHLKSVHSALAFEAVEILRIVICVQPVSVPNHSIEHMKMGPRDSYLCFIPKPLDNPPIMPEDESNADTTPARSWSLLQPLSGTCLYVCSALTSDFQTILIDFKIIEASAGMVYLFVLS
jgi:hypothetical protein